MADRSRLDITLEAARRDQQLASPAGEHLAGLTGGLQVRFLLTHADVRCSATELFDPRCDWGLHREDEDQYAILKGETEPVLFELRLESSTYRETCRIVLSEHPRELVNMRRNVWPRPDGDSDSRPKILRVSYTEGYQRGQP
jgi:hypothetical protein